MNAHRALTGTLWAKEGSRFSRSSISILASRSQARSLLLSASCSEDASASTGSGWSFRHLLTQLPTASRNQPVGPRHLRDSPVLLDYLADHLLFELTAESLYCHEPILPRFSKCGSFLPLSEKHQAPHTITSPRAPAERANALLKSFKALRYVTISPHHITTITTAALVLLTLHQPTR